MHRSRKFYNFIAASLAAFLTIALWGNYALTSYAAEENQQTVSYSSSSKIGGGYAVSGQIDAVGYATEVYDATNGLPTSDANFILGSRDGYVWIGGYSGIFRYDGTVFEKINA